MTAKELLSLASDLLNERETRPGVEHWLITEDGEDDIENYCEDCLMQHFTFADHAPEAGEDYFYCGFNMWPEEDSPVYCEDCGKVLGYTLTNYGVDEELEHFLETPLDWSSPDDCFAFNRVLNGVYSADQRRKAVKVLKRSHNKPPELLATREKQP